MVLFSILVLGYYAVLCYCQGTGTMPTPTNGTVIPSPSGNASVEYKLYGWHNCNDGRKQAILDALNDKHKIMGVDPIYNTDFSSAAIVDYLGAPGALLYSNHRGDVRTNLRNLHDFGNGWWGTTEQLQIFCGTDSMRAPYGAYCRSKPGHVHLVRKYEKNNDGLTFCDHWFDLPTLSDAIQKGSTSHDPLDLAKYENRARHWINALLMKEDVGIWPTKLNRYMHSFPGFDKKWVLTPSAAKWISKDRSDGNAAAKTVANIDNWSWYALAAFLAHSRGISTYPVRPYIPEGLNFNFQHLTSDAEEHNNPDVDWTIMGQDRR